MRKESSVKYPHSANLFRFCRKVLDHKYGGIRVIDQDVGQILSFEPADCSHWKKGKKNIKSFQAIRNIASHLGVDEKLVVDIAAGELDENEAFFEFNEYNHFEISPNVKEQAKKNFYRKNAGSWSKEKETAFKEFFDIEVRTIENIVNEIHAKINFKEAPLYLPEIVAAYPEILLIPADDLTWSDKDAPISVTHFDGKTEIRYKRATEMKPYMRFRIAKAIGEHFIKNTKNIEDLNEFKSHITNVELSIFAATLLAPAGLIRQEMGNLSVSRDIISQLAETFWVAKTFMNIRLKSILEKDGME